MRAVWKFPLMAFDTTLDMPAGAVLLDVQVQMGIPQLWALVDTDAPLTQRRIRVVGTGHEVVFNASAPYVATFQNLNLGLVWHVFDLGEPLL